MTHLTGLTCTIFHRTWTKKANIFSIYYLAAFRPECKLYSGENNKYPSYNWNSLCQWVNELNASKSLIARLRLNALHQAIYGTYSRNKDRTMMSAFRMRDRTIWNDEEKQEFAGFFENSSASSGNQYTQDELIYRDLFEVQDICQALSSASQHMYHKDLKDASALHHTLDSLFKIRSLGINDDPTIHNLTIPPLTIRHPQQCKKTFLSIKHCGVEDLYKEMENLQQKKGNKNMFQSNYQAEQWLEDLELSQEQRLILEKTKHYFDSIGLADNRNPALVEQLQLLVTGKPGVGKSYVIEKICELAERSNAGHVACMAFNGIAAGKCHILS